MDSLKLAISGMFSIITSFFAYHAAIKKHTVTTKDSDKSIFVSAITNERAKWRSELRTYSVFYIYSLLIYIRPNVGKGLPTYCLSRTVGRQPFAANYLKT